MSIRISVFAVFFGLAASVEVVAQPPGQSQDGWKIGVGGGARYAPNYVGDDDYRFSLLPSLQIQYSDRFFASVENGVGYNVVNQNGFRAGPIARINFGRNEDGRQLFAVSGQNTGDLIGLGDVDTTAELGGFFEYQFKGFNAALEIRKGVNGHHGAVADASIRYGGRSFVFGPPLIYSIGPRIKFVGDNYHSAYFGINAEQSLASGLPLFDASGGLHSYGVGATFILPLTRDNGMSAVFITGYDRLAGDAAASPLVRQRGSRNQASVGLFFRYDIK